MLIYLLESPSGKKYIGQTTQTMYARWALHKSSAKTGSNLPVHSAIRKYGHTSFKITILADVDALEDLNKLEVFYIAAYNCKTPNGYNIVDGGGGTPGAPLSDAHKAKLSAIKKLQGTNPVAIEAMRRANIGNKYRLGTKQTDEFRANASARLKGNKHALGVFFSPERREAQGLVWRGKKRSPRTAEHTEKWRASRAGYKPTEETRAKLRLAQTARRQREKAALAAS